MGAWMSGWLMHPAMLLGTAAVASPILIHLLSRRRFRRVRWAAVEFLLQAHRHNRRRMNLEQWLLLAVRCLVLMLLALVIARPFVRPGLAATLLGGASRGERIILLDDSASMACRTGETTVFDRGRAAVRQLADWFADETPQDALTVLIMSRPTQPLFASARADEAGAAAFRDALAALQPSMLAGRPDRAMAAIADTLSQRPRGVGATLYVISDFQRTEWAQTEEAAVGMPGAATRPTGGGRFADGVASLAGRGPRDAAVRGVLVDVAAPAPHNLAITGVRPLQSQVVAGVAARFEVSVANFTDVEQRQVELSLATSDLTLPPVSIAKIAPGQVARESIDVALPRAGGDYLRAALSASNADGGASRSDAARDDFAPDNERASALTVADAVRILLVDGEPDFDPYRDEVYLLRTALRPEGRVFSGNDLRVIEEAELETIDLGPFHVVVLANVYRLSDAARISLERFTAAGGGLAIFAGSQVDADVYNETLFAEGRGLLPAELTAARAPAANADEPGIGLGAWDATHPLFRSFGGAAGELLRQVRITRYLPPRIPETPSSAAAAPAASATSGASRGPAMVVATVADADASPYIVERGYGAGKVVYIAGSADLDWNSWGRDPSFVPFALELTSHLARSSGSAADLLVGESLRLPVDIAAFRPRIRLTPPGESDAPEEIDARPADGGGFEAIWSDARPIGVARIDLARLDGATQPAFAAVNLDPAESDPTPAGRDALLAALAGLPVEYVRGDSLSRSAVAAARREVWWPLLLTLVALLAGEHVLAWWFGARGAG